ncbi:M23 family metallopeptidase [Rufibacter sp. XAAS-G3-1]|uniref:M23 family metallopeptidase n=1 Tax=Rufibacter sp. XAAS-G3-1 TaxID=2729134 RepID=UPI0015E742D4|nr:M23 family metallopeptidase [Rufibacter sp. XAAS-G3-1]
MRNPLFTAVLFCICTSAHGQFNTIKKIKVLPQIQMDTATVAKLPSSFIPGYEPENTVELNEAAKKVIALVSMPLSNPIINSYYGNRIDPISGKLKFHQGIDFKANSNSVMAVMPGKIRKVAYSRSLGNYIEVEHGDYRTIYGHLSFVLVREKQEVAAGAVIGITGTTGRSTGEHLHFSVKHKGKAIDPTPVLDLIYRSVELRARNKTAGLGSN